METVESLSECELTNDIKSCQLVPFHHVDGLAFGLAQSTSQCIKISANQFFLSLESLVGEAVGKVAPVFVSIFLSMNSTKPSSAPLSAVCKLASRLRLQGGTEQRWTRDTPKSSMICVIMHKDETLSAIGQFCGCEFFRFF